MSTLFEQLAEIKPNITSEQVAEFRSCLATISQRVETEPNSLTFSLQEWGQWLEDEGYGWDEFTAILQQICVAELGEVDATTMWTYAQSMVTANDGIPCVLEHVQTDYPGLEQRIAALETLARADEHLIGHTAGGMSKTGRIITGAITGTIGGTALAYGLYRLFKPTEEQAESRLKPTGIENGVIKRGEGYEEMLRNDAVRKEQRAEEDLRDYERFADRQAEMIRHDVNIGAKFRKIEDFKQVLKDRSAKFDLKGYGEAEFSRISDSTLEKLNENIAEKLSNDRGFGEKLTDRENQLFASAKRNARGSVNVDELLRQAEFDNYAKDRIIFEKIAPLLEMNDVEFSEFKAEYPWLAKDSVEDIANFGENKIEQSLDSLASGLIDTEIRGGAKAAENAAEKKVREGITNYIESDVVKAEEKAASKVERRVRDSIEPRLTKVEERADSEVEKIYTKAIGKSESVEENFVDDLEI
jgi:hypothetical protein